MMRIDAPAQAIAVVGSCTIGDEGRAMATIYFYGPEAAEVATADNRSGPRGCVASSKVNTSPTSMLWCDDSWYFSVR